MALQALSIVLDYWVRAENEIHRKRWQQKIKTVLVHKKQTMIFLAMYEAGYDQDTMLEDEKEIQQFYRNLMVSRMSSGRRPVWSLPCPICHRHVTEIEFDIDSGDLWHRYVLSTRCRSLDCGMATRNIII